MKITDIDRETDPQVQGFFWQWGDCLSSFVKFGSFILLSTRLSPLRLVPRMNSQLGSKHVTKWYLLTSTQPSINSLWSTAG